jgi:hypothetical protein
MTAEFFHTKAVAYHRSGILEYAHNYQTRIVRVRQTTEVIEG